jgi:hypothetical protein
MSSATVAALELVLQTERVPAMEELLREMECARMAAEELRTRAASLYDTRLFSPPGTLALHLRGWAGVHYPNQPIPAVLAHVIAVLEGDDISDHEESDEDIYSEEGEEESDEDGTDAIVVA